MDIDVNCKYKFSIKNFSCILELYQVQYVHEQMFVDSYCIITRRDKNMLGKTHMAVGIATGLVILQPQSITELIIGIGTAAIGAVISDIDVGTSESHREADKIIGISSFLVLIMLLLEWKWNIGVWHRLMNDGNRARLILSAGIFLIICAWGKEQPHRSFMHSLAALVLLTGCVKMFLPVAAPYFGVAFGSHLILDLLNRKGERLFYPLQTGFSLRLCSAQGIINRFLFSAGSVISLGAVIYTLTRLM